MLDYLFFSFQLCYIFEQQMRGRTYKIFSALESSQHYTLSSRPSQNKQQKQKGLQSRRLWRSSWIITVKQIRIHSNDSDFEPDEKMALSVLYGQTFISRNVEIEWSLSPNMRQTKLSAENRIKTLPEFTRLAGTHVAGIQLTSELVIPNCIQKINLGTTIYKEGLTGEVDRTGQNTYLCTFGVLILAGVYKGTRSLRAFDNVQEMCIYVHLYKIFVTTCNCCAVDVHRQTERQRRTQAHKNTH